MSNWRDPVDDRDFELPPRPKDKDTKDIQPKQNSPNNSGKKVAWLPILSVLSIFMLCGLIAINLYIASQVNTVIKFVERGFSNPTIAATSTQIPFTPTAIIVPTLSPTATNVTALTLPAQTNTSIPAQIIGQENFPDSVIRPISLKDGELIVGTAVQFAIRDYGCNTMDTKENIPYTVFLVRGPIDVEIEIYNGGWDYWENINDENFAMSLLEPKRDEVKKHPNYLTVGHVECIIPPVK